jgi:hypothetical protein
MILPAADMVAISSDYEDTPMAFECMASRHRLGAAARADRVHDRVLDAPAGFPQRNPDPERRAARRLDGPLTVDNA